jgi:hypothetical protein
MESTAPTANAEGCSAQYSAMDMCSWLTEALDYARGLYDATGVRTEVHIIGARQNSLMFKVISAKEHNGHWFETFLYTGPRGLIESKGFSLRDIIARAVNSVHAHVKRMDATTEHVEGARKLTQARNTA